MAHDARRVASCSRARRLDRADDGILEPRHVLGRGVPIAEHLLVSLRRRVRVRAAEEDVCRRHQSTGQSIELSERSGAGFAALECKVCSYADDIERNKGDELAVMRVLHVQYTARELIKTWLALRSVAPVATEGLRRAGGRDGDRREADAECRHIRVC